ncbi:unnamed protein product [Albugo candida]|uniref:Uncharacterized protein n=1 Tax=Albugo candida TaxID=65357 RepID=A0A024GB40_9STRA|nr:unnamed protein product [Albugo candida]|eukprot:CCI43760.1 unnamed protein product [Albugo candida]
MKALHTCYKTSASMDARMQISTFSIFQSSQSHSCILMMDGDNQSKHFGDSDGGACFGKKISLSHPNTYFFTDRSCEQDECTCPSEWGKEEAPDFSLCVCFCAQIHPEMIGASAFDVISFLFLHLLLQETKISKEETFTAKNAIKALMCDNHAKYKQEKE